MKIASDFIDFLNVSPTMFHATKEIKNQLLENGHTELKENEYWKLQEKGKYFVTRNNSSIVAFKMGTQPRFNIVGAHTDSPSLKVKPTPEIYFKNYLQLAVEPYGGMILSTFFDRDLSMAGRISYLDQDDEVKSTLIDFKRPIAYIPNLAIHLNREVNDTKSFNKQKELPPIICQVEEKLTLEDLIKNLDLPSNYKKLLDHDLFFYDITKASFVGLNHEFIAGSRIDNLLSSYIGLKAFLKAGDEATSVLVCNDHEEVGSATTAGAQGNLLKSVLERITKTPEEYAIHIANSILVSADNAHAIHPNYADKHEPNHAPIINEGPVIKINANQRYATNSETSALFSKFALDSNTKIQKFVIRSDLVCGSTIGPITSTLTGIKTVDIGVPTLGMHSIRELAGTKDLLYLLDILTRFYNY